MVLSNREIVRCLEQQLFRIDPLAGSDPRKSPFGTSAVDLRLGSLISIPEQQGYPVQLDLRQGSPTKFFAHHSRHLTISEEQPYSLRPRQVLLAHTMEKVHFPINRQGMSYSARIEGRSSLARCGILVHFTAPIIHAGFRGTITLEMTNLGEYSFLLTPGMYVCQLVIEEVRGCPEDAPNQFRGQSTPVGA